MERGRLFSVLAFVAAGAAAAGCKSKQAKCEDTCNRIEAEELQKCAGAESCRATVKQTTGSCLSLCESAFSEGQARARTSPSSSAPSPEQGCAAGSAEACKDLGAIHLLGRGVPKDEGKAAQYFDKGCTLGAPMACEALGKLHRDGRGVPKDPTRAHALLTKACDGGSYGACTSLGLEALKTDKKRAHALLTKACDGKDDNGCTALAAMYLHGNGVPKDLRRARELLDKGCTLGSEAACTKLKELPVR